MENNYTYLKLIQSQNLTFWDVKSYNQQDIASQYKVEKLQNLLIEHTKKVKLFENPEDDYKILGVNNQEGLFDAYIEKGKNINQPYKKVENGYFAYNPYRINVGSIGLKSDKQKYDYISPAYVVFSCKNDLYPQYLEILLKTKYFAQAIRHNTTGSVRQTLGFDNLCNISIPLPSVEKQKELVSEYEHLQNLATQKEEDAKKIENSIDEYLLSELGIERQKQTEKEYTLFSILEYKDINKWDINYKKSNVFNTRFECKKIKDTLLPLVSRINKVNKEEYKNAGKTPIVSQEKNLISGYTDLNIASIQNEDLPIIVYGDHSQTKKLIDFNFIVGADGVRLLKPNSLFNIKYYFYFLETINFDTKQKYTRHYKYLSDILIPIPPMEIQNKIVKNIENKKDEIEFLFNESEQLKQKAISNFEQEVFN